MRIEIYYKEPVIQSTLFNSNYEFSIDDFEIIATYLASHEYGHTFFIDSIYSQYILFDRKWEFPNKTNSFLLINLFKEFLAEFYAKEFYFDDEFELRIIIKNKSPSNYPLKVLHFNDLGTTQKRIIIQILKTESYFGQMKDNGK